MKRILSLVLVISILFFTSAYAYEQTELTDVINGVISFKNGNSDLMIDEQLLVNVGVNIYDWYAFCSGRLGRPDSFEEYLNSTDNYIMTNKDLNNADYERLALAYRSCGGDISKNGLLDRAVIDSFTYDNLAEKIVNQLIFALLVLDSDFYNIPETSDVSRSALITEILSRRLDSGAVFMLNNTTPETDLTAMMITAFFPYINSGEEFVYTDINGIQCKTTVRQAVEKGLNYLSSVQNGDGAMINWGKPSCETTAQTIIALCTMGIDLETDERFIKNGNTLLDGLMSYRLENGGFAHSFEGLGKADGYASTQAVYAITAYIRGQNGYRNLFDMREERDSSLCDNIGMITYAIDFLNTADIPQAEVILEKYNNIPLQERMYVRNFYKLSSILKENNIENIADYSADDLVLSTHNVLPVSDITNKSVPASEDCIENQNDTFSILEAPKPENDSNRKMNVFEITAVFGIGVFAVCVIIFNHTYLKRKKL